MGRKKGFETKPDTTAAYQKPYQTYKYDYVSL